MIPEGRRRRLGEDLTGSGRSAAPGAAPLSVVTPLRQALLERAVGRSRLLLLVLEGDGTVLLAEGGGVGGIGLAPDIAIGRPGLDCLGHEGDVVEAVTRALRGETASALVQRGQREIELTFEPVDDPDEGRPLVLVVGTDVTAYRVA